MLIHRVENKLDVHKVIMKKRIIRVASVKGEERDINIRYALSNDVWLAL